jgi:outer membrane protein insertion porin family
VDFFRTVTDSYTAAASNYSYSESDIGADMRLGYRFNQNVRQNFTYTLSQRDVYDIATGTSQSLYIENEAGVSSLSQLSQTLSFDYVDDDQNPTSGLIVDLTTDFAGFGGTAKYVRISPDASYYVPLERVFGSNAWVLKFAASGGDLIPILGYEDKIEDRFFLGGDSLRGFADGGVGPSVAQNAAGTVSGSGDEIGGNKMWTQSTELHFPLPVSPDLGVTGFAFVDVGSVFGAKELSFGGARQPINDSSAPRVGTGIGVSWNTPFGLINLSLAEPIVKQKGDQIQQFRVSFGTRF